MYRSAAMAQFAVHLPGTLRTLHRYGKFGIKVAIQAAGVDIRLHVGRHGEDEGAVRGFSAGAGLVLKMRQLQVHVAVGSVRMNAPAGLEHFNIAVHSVQVFHGFDARNAQRAVHRADMLDPRPARNAASASAGSPSRSFCTSTLPSFFTRTWSFTKPCKPARCASAGYEGFGELTSRFWKLSGSSATPPRNVISKFMSQLSSQSVLASEEAGISVGIDDAGPGPLEKDTASKPFSFNRLLRRSTCSRMSDS